MAAFRFSSFLVFFFLLQTVSCENFEMYFSPKRGLGFVNGNGTKIAHNSVQPIVFDSINFHLNPEYEKRKILHCLTKHSTKKDFTI